MIKIEVTGNSIPEVADKLLAIGHSLYSKTVVPVANGGTGAQTEADFEVPDFTIEMQDGNVVRITPTETEKVLPEVAEAAPVDPTPAPKSAPVATVSESLRTTTETSSTRAPATSASEDEALEVVDLPIAVPEVNLRDLVLSVVEKRGKPFMEEILTRFGVAKASMVSPELLPELIDLCNEALSK